jgi:D-mannonate dehydratase
MLAPLLKDFSVEEIIQAYKDFIEPLDEYGLKNAAYNFSSHNALAAQTILNANRKKNEEKRVYNIAKENTWKQIEREAAAQREKNKRESEQAARNLAELEQQMEN